MNGGEGNDTVSFAGSVAGVTVNLATSEVHGGNAEGDTITGFENVTGTAQFDILTGSDQANVIDGGAGNDLLKGGGGADTLTGGAGNDQIDGGAGDDTAVFDVDFNTVNVTFEGKTIVIESAAGRDVLTGIEHLRFTDGTIDLKDENPLVNDLFYYAHNRDVWDAGVDADVHYATFGFREGRDPNAEFSTKGYLSANADVRAAGINPLEHFATVGFKEGRDPSAHFDIEQYLAANPDVAISGIDPLTHFEAFGRDEGRAIFGAVGKPSHDGFDAEFYLLNNPDVGFAGANPLQHYQVFGHNEGRDPNAFFDVKGYLAAYSDVAASGVDPFQHYLASVPPKGAIPRARSTPGRIWRRTRTSRPRASIRWCTSSSSACTRDARRMATGCSRNVSGSRVACKRGPQGPRLFSMLGRELSPSPFPSPACGRGWPDRAQRRRAGEGAFFGDAAAQCAKSPHGEQHKRLSRRSLSASHRTCPHARSILSPCSRSGPPLPQAGEGKAARPRSPVPLDQINQRKIVGILRRGLRPRRIALGLVHAGVADRELGGAVPHRLAAGAQLAQVGLQPFLAQQALRLAMRRRGERQDHDPAALDHVDFFGWRDGHEVSFAPSAGRGFARAGRIMRPRAGPPQNSCPGPGTRCLRARSGRLVPGSGRAFHMMSDRRSAVGRAGAPRFSRERSRFPAAFGPPARRDLHHRRTKAPSPSPTAPPPRWPGASRSAGVDKWCVSWRLYRPDGTPLPLEECPMALALKERRAVRDIEIIAERPDGQRLPVMPFPTPLHDAAGNFVGAVNVLMDISKLKRAEREEARRADVQAALYRFTDRLYRAAGMEETIEAALDAIVEALGCPRASILLMDAAGIARFAGWRGLSEGYRAAVEGHCPWRMGERDPQPIFVPDIELADEPESAQGGRARRRHPRSRVHSAGRAWRRDRQVHDL